MPGSVFSRVSVGGSPRSGLAASYAKEVAQREIAFRVQNGEINRNDKNTIEKEYKAAYIREYYRHYAFFCQQDQQPTKIIYIPTDNPAARKYLNRHAVAKFSRLNCFIHAHKECITVGRISFPLNEEISPDTKEAFLSDWPGPLDRPDEKMSRKVYDYIESLCYYDSQRKIRYCNNFNDEQRKTILRLLTEMLQGNGTVAATCITRLLVEPDKTEIQKEEGNKKPLDALQKNLILGKRGEAIRLAKSRKLWDHAQCLAFLDKFQPPNTEKYFRNSQRLIDDPIVQLNDEFIQSVDNSVLSTIYRALLNRILANDPESVRIVKHANVANDPYMYAMLSANDCEMEFDQSNEMFKLISAIKQVTTNPGAAYNHLISLGYITTELFETSDDLSYRTHVSFKQSDTYTSRTLTISNIDMLLLNEIWEYCLNLARGTCDSMNYNYIVNLLPYKIVFASRLLDYGLHSMFANYLDSIKNAISMVRNYSGFDWADPYYDWNAIVQSVEHLGKVWDVFTKSSEPFPQQTFSLDALGPSDSPRINDELSRPNNHEEQLNSLPVTSVQNNSQPDDLPPPQNQGDTSSFSYDPPQGRDPFSFESAYSPISEVEDLPRDRESFSFGSPPIEESREAPNFEHRPSLSEDPINQSNNQSDIKMAPPSGDQINQAGFFTNLVSSAKNILPKNNSKPMILPDDSNKSIVYDEGKGGWLDKSQPDGAGAGGMFEPPPLMSESNPPTYSMASKSTKSRYPKPQFK